MTVRTQSTGVAPPGGEGHSDEVRWQALFGDLEAQAEALDRADLDAEVRDRTRREQARLQATDRLRAALGAQLRLSVLGGGVVSGRLTAAGIDWLLVEEQGREVLVPWRAVLSVRGVGRQVAGAIGRVEAKLDLRHALRGVARDRAPVQLLLVDGSVLLGTVDRVAADHLDLAEHAAHELRRASAVTGSQLVPLDAVALVRTA